jgi:glyoxylase-like metal-dependent hydrolase (beta-lactamase superfamily II)
MPADVIKVGPLGPYANNSYVIADIATKRAVVVDTPFETARTIEAARPYAVGSIVVTHRHGDHWAEIDVAREEFGVPVYCHEGDRKPYEAKVDGTLGDGDTIALGETAIRVLHTPGHTPGSICLLVPMESGQALISGDTLFPGGPGRSDNPAALREMIRSITSKLLVLHEDTIVLPGHGDNTTIEHAKREYAVFASKGHPDDLCGDVTWEGA